MVFYIGVIFTRPSSFPMAAKLGESVLDTIIKRGERRLKNKEMRFNFKKISALGTSLFLAGATLGIAAAANYPAPFVEGGAADVAIVVGTGEGVSLLDSLEAGFISTDLQAEMGGTGATEASVTGEAVSLDTSATRIWINTSLNTAKSTLTKSDLPTVLSDYTFNGNVDAKITSTIKLQAGAAAGSDNSGKVIFAKQPKSNVDPVLGVSLGTSHSSNPLYNASATMRATNFTHSDSIGSEIQLFGQKFTVSADTSISDTTKIVLLKEAEKFSLDSNNPSKTVEIGGETYTITLVSASDTAATVQVTDSAGTSDSKEVSEADSKKINGVEVGVTAADETNLLLSATIIAGAQKLTFTQGTQVTTGSSGDPIDGTYVHLVGGAGAVTELAVTVYRPDSSTDAIVAGDSFVDPVFGSFKFEFAGMSSPLDDASRGIIELDNSGDDSMTMTMTDDSGNKATFDVSHNQSGVHRLLDDSNYTIHVTEMSNLTEDEYVVIGNEDYGHLLRVNRIYNSSSTDYTYDAVDFIDVITGDTYSSTFTSEGSGTVDVDGKRYTVTFELSGSDGWATLKYPTSDSASANVGIFFPTIKSDSGALVALYEPSLIDLSNFDGGGNDLTTIKFPDGDGYTSATLLWVGNESAGASSGEWNVTVGSTTTRIQSDVVNSHVNITVGQLIYTINATDTTDNRTTIYLRDPESTGAFIDQPAVIVTEGKDDNTQYHAIVVDFETSPGGTSSNGIGVNDVLFSSDYGHYSASLASDSDITHDVDWWGTLAVLNADDSDQKTLTLKIPSSQIYAQLYIGEIAAAITPGTSGSTGTSTPIGEVLVKDSEVSSVGTKNLIVVGGSCINSAAATLVGGAYCGQAWTDATNVAAGEFLLKGYATNSLTTKLALLVAGYNAADTVNAAKYLRTQTVDTSKHYKGTSSTSAELVVAE